MAVSHADPIKAAVAQAAGTPLDLFQRLTVAPCSVSAIAYTGGGPFVLTVNSTASLERPGRSAVTEGYDLVRPTGSPSAPSAPSGAASSSSSAAQGATLLTLKIEKQQVAAMADYLARVVKDQQRPGHLPDDQPLEEPAEPAWAVGTIGVSFDEAEDRVVLVIEELVPERRGGSHRPGVHHPRAGGRLLHPGHPTGRVRTAALPAVRLPARPLRTRMPADQRPPSTGRVSGWRPGDRSVARGGRPAAGHP